MSPLQLISTLSAEGPALPAALVLQIAEGVRLWNTKVAALISRAQAEGQINAEEDPDLLAALFINCWQGATIRSKCDPICPVRLSTIRVGPRFGHVANWMPQKTRIDKTNLLI